MPLPWFARRARSKRGHGAGAAARPDHIPDGQDSLTMAITDPASTKITIAT
jgi:hypothetical protein